MVPQSLGYATISGVPVQYGLYSAVIALIVYAIFGSSRHVVTGTHVTGEKMDKFLEHFAKEIDKHMEHFGGKLFK